MLGFFRSTAGSWFVKGILGIIIISFGIWGISGAFRFNSNSHLVARIGNIDISKAAFSHEIKMQLANIEKETGKKITLFDLFQMGLVHQILENKINEILLHLESNDFKIMTPDKLVLDVIKQDPLFQENNQFSREKFDHILKINRMNERNFVNQKRQKIAHLQILSAISAGGYLPASLLNSFFSTFFEKRKVSIIVPQIQISPKKITDSEVKKYYELNKEKFRAPEYRSFKALILNPVELSKLVTVSEKEIQETYEQQKEDFYEQEKRDALMIRVQDDAEANKVKAWLKEGQLKNIKDAIPLQQATKADLLEEIAGPVFTLGAGEASNIIDSPSMGQKFIVYVQKVYPVKLRTLAQVRGQVQEELKRQKALDLIATISKTIEDKVAAGVSFKEIAQEFHLKYIEIDGCTYQGILKNGQKVVGGIHEEILKTVFETSEKSESPLIEVEDGNIINSFIVRNEKIEPSVIQPFSGVSENVKKLLIENIKKEDQIAKIHQISRMYKQGKSIEEIIKVIPVNIYSITIDPADAKTYDKLDKKSVFDLFSVKEKDTIPVVYQKQYALGIINAIFPADISQDKNRADMVKKVLLMDINKEIVMQYFAALREKFGVKIYEDSISSLINSGGQVDQTIPIDM